MRAALASSNQQRCVRPPLFHTYTRLENDLVISQVKATCRHSVEDVWVTEAARGTALSCWKTSHETMYRATCAEKSRASARTVAI